MPLQVHGVAARDELHVVERGRGRGERDAVHVERLAHAIHEVGHRRVRERVADAQPGQAVGLGEGARDDQVRMALAATSRVSARSSRGRYSLYASSSTTSDARAAPRRRNASSSSAPREGAGRVVRIGDEDDARLVVDRARHRLEVVAVVLRRHHDRRARRAPAWRADRPRRRAANTPPRVPARGTRARPARARRSSRCRARSQSVSTP